MAHSEEYHIISLPVVVICSVGALANAMLLIALVKDPLKCFRNSATYLIGNLALSDFIFTCVTIPSIYAGTLTSFSILKRFAFYLSMGTIFSIALDRYFMVCHPFKHRLFMSGNRMALWIGMVWVLSAVLTTTMFAPSGTDITIKICIGLILILLMAVFYGKTYYSLKKQAKSMLGKRSALPPERGDIVSNKSKSTDAENRVTNNAWCKEIPSSNHTQNSFAKNVGRQNDTARDENCGQFQSKNPSAEYESSERHENENSGPHECAQSGDVSGYSRDDVNEERNKPSLEQVTRAENHPERAPRNLGERGERDHPEGAPRNRFERAESHSKRAGNCDQRTESHDIRVQSHDEVVLCFNERCENHSQRAEAQDERFRFQDERVCNHVNYAISQNDICDIPTRPMTSITDKPSTKKRKCPQIVNVKEQKFLNTIIIIAFVAVITIVPGTIVFWYRSHVHEFFTVLAKVIICLNFAVNPFIYFWRLERYRKTFKMVFGCKT